MNECMREKIFSWQRDICCLIITLNSSRTPLSEPRVRREATFVTLGGEKSKLKSSLCEYIAINSSIKSIVIIYAEKFRKLKFLLVFMMTNICSASSFSLGYSNCSNINRSPKTSSGQSGSYILRYPQKIVIQSCCN